MNSPIDHDQIEAVMVLENSNIFQWISIHQYAVSVVAWLDFTEFMLLHEKFGNTSSGRNDGLHWSVFAQFHEVLQVSRVGSMRRPGKTVVTPSIISELVSKFRHGTVEYRKGHTEEQ